MLVGQARPREVRPREKEGVAYPAAQGNVIALLQDILRLPRDMVVGELYKAGFPEIAQRLDRDITREDKEALEAQAREFAEQERIEKERQEREREAAEAHLREMASRVEDAPEEKAPEGKEPEPSDGQEITDGQGHEETGEPVSGEEKKEEKAPEPEVKPEPGKEKKEPKKQPSKKSNTKSRK